MSSTSQLTTFSDLYTDLLQRVRVTTSVSASVEQAKRYINIALHDIHLGFDYKLPWCERVGYLRTKAPYTTGTVAATRGSGTLSGTGTAWNTNDAFSVKNVVAHGKIIVDGSTEVYKVNTITNDTSLSLYTNFIGDTVSGATYTYFEDEYSLSASFLRPIDFEIFSPDMGIQLIPRHEFRRRFPVIRISGRPRVACLVDTIASGSVVTPVRKVILYPYPDQEYLIPYHFVTSQIARDTAGVTPASSLSADSDEPYMPLRYRHAIIFHALYHWYRDKKDDARSEQAKAEYTDIMMRIVNDQDIATHMTTKMSPTGGGYQRAAYRPYSLGAGSRVYDLNDEWDSFRRG
jgi:hypothetical protein